MTTRTPDDLLVLHAVRTLGYADQARIARRAGLPPADALEHLLDAQARGWTAHTAYAGDGGWSLTEAGRAHDERLLAAELEAADARGLVEEVLRDFLPANESVSAACTAWQLTEMGLATTPVGLAETLERLSTPGALLIRLEERLTARLARFGGYAARFAAALESAQSDPAWITGIDRDSCHRTWFELHEDLLATLGLTR